MAPSRRGRYQADMHQLLIRGAHAHNLRHIDLDLPLGQWIAVTGPSGSGKTSLVFDTVVRESQRRFLGGLSPRARLYLGKLGEGAASEIDNLPVAVSIGAHSNSTSGRSTVGTRTGALDLLRLCFARDAASDTPLRRSHFSFNHPDGACPACTGDGTEVAVDPALLIADPRKSLRDGALKPTLKNGYTVYSQVTLDVMNDICAAHGFDVHTPWDQLSDAQTDVILYGTRALKVPFGKHGLESRMKWAGITARPREEGYYRGLVPVIEETLKRDRNPNILRFVRTAPCRSCHGTRLGPTGRSARVGDRTLPSLLALPAEQLRTQLSAMPQSPTWAAVLPDLRRRLDRMVALSLGHLSLDRRAPDLSDGEAQRLGLVSQLTGDLGGMLIALDEPTLGLHPDAQAGMAAMLDDLRDQGNTVLVVEHDPDMVCWADHLVRMGPGAGPNGGAVVSAGPLPPRPLGQAPAAAKHPLPIDHSVVLRGASLHTLKQAELRVPLARFTVVMGPSGAGKSSLVFQTLLPALQGRAGGPYSELIGRPDRLDVQAVDASPIGRTPRSTPATWTGLFDMVRKRFAATDEARARGWTASRFSYNTAAGRCPRCDGLGYERIGMHLLQDVDRPCPGCLGQRYANETLEVRVDGRHIADVLALTVDTALRCFPERSAEAKICHAMSDLGLGYLRLGQPSTTLSRGEAQRVKLATLIARPRAAPTLMVMDEPDRGLHPDDVRRLLAAFAKLRDAGHTVLAISHHRHLWAAADHRVSMRDGETTHDAPLPPPPKLKQRPPRAPSPPPATIRLRGVRTHHLTNLNVDIPHRQITAITGISGSGKSSLAFHTLAAEGTRRFAESLPFQVRRHLRRTNRPDLDQATGLTPTVVLQQTPGRAGGRSTVATQSGLGPLLRLLWARAGDSADTLSASHFSRDRVQGACPACAGLATVPTADPGLLITHPTAPIAHGACAGTHPGRFFTDADGQYMATLAAAVAHLPDNDLSVPWRDLPAPVQHIALRGAGPQIFDVSWSYRRGRRAGTHTFTGPWPGLLALVEREAQRRAKQRSAPKWAEALIDRPCPACDGAGLRPSIAAVAVGGLTLPAVQALPLFQVGEALAGARDACDPAKRPIVDAVLPGVLARLDDIHALGLGHLRLNRRSRSLSNGELQRVRLASVLQAHLTGLTMVLDEPGNGLHTRDLTHLLTRLRALRDAGNTVVLVTHRPTLLTGADHLIALGPGAGSAGGTITFQGPPTRHPPTPPQRPPPLPPMDTAPIQIRGARAHTLRDLDLDLPSAGIVAITGVSGSGKSSLLFDVIGDSAAAQSPRGCASLTGLQRFARVLDARAISESDSPLMCLGLMPALQRYLHQPETKLPRAAFSYRSPAGRCASCKGSGVEAVSLDFLEDLQLPCPTCNGDRYRPDVLAIRRDGRNVAEWLRLPASRVAAELGSGPLQRGARAMCRLGLGHIALGRRRTTLSGGEWTRVRLAASLLDTAAPTLHLLDEPGLGLHESDLHTLISALRALTARGDLVIMAVHRLTLVEAADLVVELGPEGGPEGGMLIDMATALALREGPTAAALRQRATTTRGAQGTL